MKEIEARFIYVVTTNITQAYTKLTFLFSPYYPVQPFAFSLFYFSHSTIICGVPKKTYYMHQIQPFS